MINTKAIRSSVKTLWQNLQKTIERKYKNKSEAFNVKKWFHHNLWHFLKELVIKFVAVDILMSLTNPIVGLCFNLCLAFDLVVDTLINKLGMALFLNIYV